MTIAYVGILLCELTIEADTSIDASKCTDARNLKKRTTKTIMMTKQMYLTITQLLSMRQSVPKVVNPLVWYMHVANTNTWVTASQAEYILFSKYCLYMN